MGFVDQDAQTERTLWERAQHDDRAAFGALYRLHAPRVRGLCRSLLGHGLARADLGTRCEDVLSDTFLQAWRRRLQITVADSLLPWLLGTAARLCANERRSALRAVRLQARLAALGHSELPPQSAHMHSGDRLELRAIERAIAALPSAYRDVVRVCLVQGSSVREASRLLGVPEGTIKSRVSRARSLLKQQLLAVAER